MTPERRDAIVRLLRTRDEGLPELIHRSESSSGFVHDGSKNIETCPDCLANDRVMFGCETCGGAGVVRAPRKRDPYATDVVLPFGFDVDRHEQMRARDREIDLLARQLAPPRSEADLLAEANAHPYSWELARRRMYRLFDYGALDRSLARLHVSDDAASRALHAVFVYGWQLEPAAGPLRVALERGLAFLDGVLPDPLRAPGEPTPEPQLAGRVERGAGDRARAARDTEIRRAVLDARIPTGDVARTWGISVSQVNRIVAAAA